MTDRHNLSEFLICAYFAFCVTLSTFQDDFNFFCFAELRRDINLKHVNFIVRIKSPPRELLKLTD